MGIFKRTKAQSATSVGGDLFTDRERERVDALWRLTALPRDAFEATYGVMLGRFWRYVSAPKGEAWTMVKSESLTCAVAALRARQAHVLPRFGAAEDAARLAEVMSFALAAAVLAERIGLAAGRAPAAGWCPATEDVPASTVLEDVSVPRAYGALLLPRLVGDAGLRWLAQEPVAMRALAAYFGGGPSELRAIAEAAAARIGLPIEGAATVPCGSTATASPEPADRAEPTARPESPAPSVDAEPSGSGPGAEETTEGPVVVGGLGAGWRWINWVRAGLRDGSIVANADGGWLHNLGGDAYCVRPACFEAYAAVEGVAMGTIKNRVAKLRRHRLRKWERGVANTFRAELADGRRVEGMLFPGALIWDDDPPPLADADLR